MLHGLQEAGTLPASRMCVRCKFFDPFRYESSSSPHHCHRAQVPLADGQLRIDCAIFEAGDAAKQAAVWERFAGHRHEESETVEDPAEDVETVTAHATETREEVCEMSADAPEGQRTQLNV
jgi:hypothetical protein